jgi:hypothetical protein
MPQSNISGLSDGWYGLCIISLDLAQVAIMQEPPTSNLTRERKWFCSESIPPTLPTP